MQQFKPIRLACVLVAVMASLSGGPAGARAPQRVPCGAWNIVKSPNPFQSINVLNAVTAVSASDVWAVGWGAASENSNYLTLIEHWNGTTWQVVPSPSPSAYGNILTAVTAVSASDVWAVGYDDQDSQTMTEHWDGTHWTVIPSPNVGVIRNILTSVTAVSPDNVWAVGFSTNDFQKPFSTLIEHWDGARWRVISSPNVEHSSDFLWGVTALSPQDIWAVGYYWNLKQHNSPAITLTEHWDGIRWRIVPSPNRGTEGSSLDSVTTVSAQDVWAVGQSGVNATLTEQWNSIGWSIIKSPNGPSKDNNVLYGVTAITAKDIWTVGRYLDYFQHDHFLTMTQHWDGTDWTLIASPNPAAYNFLTGVTATSTKNVWAVGYSQNLLGPLNPSSTLIEHYC